MTMIRLERKAHVCFVFFSPFAQEQRLSREKSREEGVHSKFLLLTNSKDHTPWGRRIGNKKEEIFGMILNKMVRKGSRYIFTGQTAWRRFENDCVSIYIC